MVTPWVVVAAVVADVVMVTIDAVAADDGNGDDVVSICTDDGEAIPAPPLIRFVNSGAVVVVPLCSR